MREHTRVFWPLATVVVSIWGCGGGSSGSHTAGVSQTSKAGDAVLTYFGDPKPMLTTSAGTVSVVAQAGATYSNVTLEPPPNLNDTYLAFARQEGGTGELYEVPYGSSSPQLLFQTANGTSYPGISAYGAVSFIEQPNPTSLTNWSIRPDGTGLKQLSFGGTFAVGPQFSVDGTNRVAFTDVTTNLYIAPGTGGTPTKIQTNAVPELVAWSPAGTSIAYGVPNAGATARDLYTTSTSGATLTDVTPTALQGTMTFYSPAWSADGVTIVASAIPSGGANEELFKFAVNSPLNSQLLTPSGFSDDDPVFSPDGSKLAFYRSTAGGATAGLYISDAAGANPTLVVSDANGTLDGGGIAWSPFLPKETVVAASGSTFYHQAASGFLMSQVNSQFGSLVAFTAATPSSAAIQAPAATSANQPMLFTLTGDSITSIGYINNYFNPGTTITLTSTPTVVLSVDATTGQVDMVAPASTTKPASATNSDGTVTYRAAFKAIYDAKGANLAPSGAGQIVVNPKTGKLVSFK